MDPTNQPPVTAEPATAPNPKQQIVEQVRSGKNVLVTVGNNPSVDELAAALGLTFMLDKLEKHVTAVFSGDIPPALTFLEPERTFENSVDSLRDFIIALDKNKAAKVRIPPPKPEDKVVKVYIVPYKTVLKKEDFSFSQGDLNVDVIVALGVKKQEDIDKAITSHGRILHDASVISINAGEQAGDLGAINWNDPAASSISEMLVSISEAFGSGLLDEQISTAFLTGIVAETNRFSNEKTSPKVMTMAAQLMAAGANQQLIASNLRQEGMISGPPRKKTSHRKNEDKEVTLDHHQSDNNQAKDDKKTEAPKQSGESNTEAKTDQPKSGAPGNSSLANGSSTSSKGSAPADSLPVPPPANGQSPSPVPLELPAAPDPALTPPPVPAASPLPKPSAEPQLPVSPAPLPAASPVPEKNEAQAGDDAVEAARKAVEDAALEQPAPAPIPAPQAPPVEADPLPAISHSFASSQPSPFSAAASEPEPVDAFMQPHAPASQPLTFSANEDSAVPFAAANGATQPMPAPVPGAANMPPLPPLPNVPGGALPPLPPLPGQPADPRANFQPQINPGFMQDLPQSQNQWTAAGQDIAAKQAQDQANRQAKMDQMTQQYDQAVERNQEIKRQNNPDDHSTFPLPR